MIPKFVYCLPSWSDDRLYLLTVDQAIEVCIAHNWLWETKTKIRVTFYVIDMKTIYLRCPDDIKGNRTLNSSTPNTTFTPCHLILCTLHQCVLSCLRLFKLNTEEQITHKENLTKNFTKLKLKFTLILG